jgi:hypothetical protein
LKCIDISDLCLCIGNLCLDSPRRTEKGDLPFDSKDSVYNSNSGSDIPVPVSAIDGSGSGKCTQVTNQLQDFAPTSSGDSTFVLENSEEYGLGVLQNFEIINEAHGIESPKKDPVLLEPAKTFDSEISSVEDSLPTLAENGTSTTETVKIDKKIEVELSKTVEHNHTDIHQAVAESNEIRDKISLVVDDSKEAVSRESDPHNTENIQVRQGTVTVNEAQENHVVDFTKDLKKSDITEEIFLTEAEDINSAPAKVDTNISTPFSSTVHVDEPSDSAWTSTSHEDLSAEKEAVSEFTDPAVHTKSEPEAGLTLISAKVPDRASLVAAPIPATFVDIEARDWKLPVDTERLEEVVKETPAVLSELFEICNRQQKDLELGDEKFVDGTEFFTSPSKPENLREKFELHVPPSSVPSKLEESILNQPVAGEFEEFDQTIADEAENISQEIMNSSSECHETDLTAGDSRHSNNTQLTNSLNITDVMAGMQRVSNSTSTAMDENNVNPFVSQSLLRRSPPHGKTSPRSSGSVSSPCESQRTKSKLSSINALKDSSSPCNHDSPNAQSGRNSPDHRTFCNKVNKKFCVIDITLF